ncbi:hypothetical protein CSHISOI_10713 [Colletotrichum shisoi]|uniref:C2H2-type domain-containing protein n=1 Tax=Colletotrichum shisoi TaxID=2078593 RepID=A0A5Q4BCQ7_9PEZI|nr:hypothetical protein CSHISOI_10713 [Colletotrichum shisoi]
MTDNVRKNEQFENEYDRQLHVHKYAITAGQIINKSTDGVDQTKIAALASDVGRKLKHYATKNQSASTIYNDVRRQPIESATAELSSIIAIRSHIDIDLMRKVAPALVKKFAEEKPLGCEDIDSYIHAKIQTLQNSQYQPARKFKESHMKKPGHWGKEIDMISGIADIEEYKRELISPIEGGEAVMTLNQWRLRENESRNDQNEKWERLLTAMMRGEIRELLTLRRLNNNMGPPIIDEKDMIDIFCPLCEEDVYYDDLKTLWQHWQAAKHGDRDHMYKTMGRRGSLLKWRHTIRTNSNPPQVQTAKPPMLLACPACHLKAETFDAILWHWQKNHERQMGLFEETVETDAWVLFQTWRGTRKETRCTYCYRSGDWEEEHSTDNVTPGSGICYTKLTADEHEVWHQAQLMRGTKRTISPGTTDDDDEENLDTNPKSPKRRKAEFDFSLIHIENRGYELCADCHNLIADHGHLIDFLYHWTEKHGDAMIYGEIKINPQLIPDMETYAEYLEDAEVVCDFCTEDDPLHMDEKALAIHQKRQHAIEIDQQSGIQPCWVAECGTITDDIMTHMSEAHGATHFHCAYCQQKSGTHEFHLVEQKKTHLTSHLPDFARDRQRSYDPNHRQEPLLLYLQLETYKAAATTVPEIREAMNRA